MISKIIKLTTNSNNYSHVALLLDELHVLQLDWKTAISIQHLNYKYEEYDVYETNFKLSEHEKELLYIFLINKLSTTYDWKFIISRFFNFIFNTPIYNSSDKYNCDELIVEAFYSVLGIKLLDDGVKLSPESLSKSKYLIKIK